jgi:hypothetical protein
MTFVKRRIDLQFQLGTGTFGDSGMNIVTVSGLRVHAHIVKAGAETLGECQLSIFGLLPTLMNQLSALAAYDMVVRQNTVIVKAGDDVNGLSTVFEGTISEGWADLNSAPDTRLQVIAFAGLYQKLKPVAPSSYPGAADAAVIMQNIANTMGLSFENNGVSVQLGSPYFPGTAWEQARSCAEAAGINWTIDKGTLAIWNNPGHRAGTAPLISPSTGMVGYPAYTGVGVGVKTLFNPLINPGGTAQVQSEIGNACGTWYVTDVSYDLQSETPGGAWFTEFNGRVLS